ncbi:MAG: ammonia-forming cytochrome c nitrite reductase subunit c552 [Proteobacteria bacterium]|nr:ammonia-forming cytochrome c nitrite reductase subunit c552 [Pseudomonadota bacterium]
MTRETPSTSRMRTALIVVLGITAVVTAAVTLLLVNIFERKSEAYAPWVRFEKVDEDTTDPAIWGRDFPRQYDSYQRTALPTQTRFGGHGGSEALPEEKIERDPWLKRMFQGYAFAIDYRDRRGHAYMLTDQENTLRLTKPQSGSCLHCHASVMPLYRKLGDGDAFKGMDATHKMSYTETHQMLKDMGHLHPVSCVDCHEPASMSIRVTRPGFLRGIAEFANSSQGAPFAPSIEQWRKGNKKRPYDPNRDATRQEMRSFVCAQCHVEYYCSSEIPLTFPWGKGLSVESSEAYWNALKFPSGERFFDYRHAETGAEILKAQHPEFELWSQGIHARSGVACADCHMPYMRDGASKVSDHWVRSPLLNIQRACQTCHYLPESEIAARVDVIQERNYNLLQRSGAAINDMIDAIVAAKEQGVAEAALQPVLELQRQAQWRIDYIAAENSMGFHAPQEAARILGDAIDMARQGENMAMRLSRGCPTTAPVPAESPATPETPDASPAPADGADAEVPAEAPAVDTATVAGNI